ncbi:aspartate 1-decarboxylase [Bradyrhizobium sp. BWC-3-1]|uniref:aspartate 1-decarboxylase n=1 Tax=Bradyrhizobium sp. BWC-3-1 TaxID=3080012 RepID=UPI00293E9A70|nr:aspartate 1-decarboxylase [Bradyrhizobium sp. BWC-3-1]WOH57706.1 aspartate 1-decarboxylase [Bradyrhizobium sp. BWC-3-1]
MRTVVAAKPHDIHVTGANSHYRGSITLDSDQCTSEGILPMEFVDIWTKNSWARISANVIFGAPASRRWALHGAAAHTCQVGDQIIVRGSTYLDEKEIAPLRPRILAFDRDKCIADRMTYPVTRDRTDRYCFETLGEAGDVKPIPLRCAESN